ncbi:MAG: hypothetical protein AAGF59_09535 [Pseudomonadota bacterium]
MKGKTVVPEKTVVLDKTGEADRTGPDIDWPASSLVAYLDGEMALKDAAKLETALEADESLRDQLDDLEVDKETLDLALAHVLESAPPPDSFGDNPKTQSDEVGSVTPPEPKSDHRAGTMPVGWVAMVAGGAALFLVGVWTGTAIDDLFPKTGTAQTIATEAEGTDRAWLTALPATLDRIAEEGPGPVDRDPFAVIREFDSVAEAIELTLGVQDITPPDLVLNQAENVSVTDVQTAKILFLGDDGLPVVLFIRRTVLPDQDSRTERAGTLTISDWVYNGHQFAIVGSLTVSQGRRLAGALQDRIAR